MIENEIAGIVFDICFGIHKKYGPGLFENIYETILCYEFEKNSIAYERQKNIRVYHDGIDMGIGFVPDVIVEKKVIVELKSVEKIIEVHHKQILTYLKITGLKLGLLINFQVPLLKNGIHRVANTLY
jgi:GxxExxY protein